MNIDELARSAGTELREWQPAERRWQPASVTNDGRSPRGWRGYVAAAAAVVLLAGGAFAVTGLGDSKGDEQIEIADGGSDADAVTIKFSCFVGAAGGGGLDEAGANAVSSLPYVSDWEELPDAGLPGITVIAGLLSVVPAPGALNQSALFASSVFETAALQADMNCATEVGAIDRRTGDEATTQRLACRVPMQWEDSDSFYGVPLAFIDALNAESTAIAWEAPRTWSIVDGYGVVMVTFGQMAAESNGGIAEIPTSIVSATQALVAEGHSATQCFDSAASSIAFAGSTQPEIDFADLVSSVSGAVDDSTAGLDDTAFVAWLDDGLDSTLASFGVDAADAADWRSFLLSNRSE